MMINMLPRVQCSNKDESWECHWNTAIADIRKYYRLYSDTTAEDMLCKATLQNPIELDEVLMWLN